MVSNEYSIMTRDGEVQTILPNVKFDSIPAGFKMHSTVTVLSDDKKRRIATLNAGDITTEIKDLQIPKPTVTVDKEVPKDVIKPKRAVTPKGD